MKIFRNALTLLLLMTAVSMKAQMPVQSDADAKYATELLQKGSVAPAFKLKTRDGRMFNSTKLKGKYAVIDFWASWCPDCRKDAPNLVRMYQEFHQKGVEFVGVSFDTDVTAWNKGIAKYNIPYTQVSELKMFQPRKLKSSTKRSHLCPSVIFMDSLSA